MNWARLAAIIVGAGIVSSFTDWFFAGDWIHRRYTYPEIWRQGEESRAIALTSPLPFVTCGVFAFVAARLGLHSVPSPPDSTRSWEGGLPYRIGLELYRNLNQEAQISRESVVNLISLCASSNRTHRQTRWLPLILEWMNDDYSCTLTLTQASKQAGVHPVHVSRSFRRTLGCTFREYLTLIRIRRATDLLKQSSACITEIAFACGFSDHAHFTRTFKRATGLTPTAYRIQVG